MKITILGAGAYALGLAVRLSQTNKNIMVWSKVPSEIESLINSKTNEKALPGVIMPDNIKYTMDIKEALNKANIVVIAVATKFVGSTCLEMKPYSKNKHFVIASKGIDQISNKFASSIVRDVLNTKKICTISGPSFAKDIVTEEKIGLSLAATNRNTRKLVKETFSSGNLKIRTTNDFVGVELCGTMKNIIAVASGILDGLKVSESTKALFLTECLNDIRLLIRKMGGNEKTILSFAGFGDIILTCTSPSSRNYTYGKMIGENKSNEELEKYLSTTTVEGIYTLESIYNIIKNKRIKYPFLDLMYLVVKQKKRPEEMVEFLIEKK